ncbi:hypothetical protein Q1695_007905 [Nippostrongylus brasiliensis]|nr:hypothetical protein Q1695_007905 [Nippostrongylus brasiliensis]
MKNTTLRQPSSEKNKEEFLRDDSLPTRKFVKSRFENLSRKSNKKIEETRSLINMHVDELEEQVSKLREEVRGWGVVPLMKDMKAFTTRMILLEAEMKHAFQEMDFSRSLDRLEKKLSVLPEILEAMKSLQKPGSDSPEEERKEDPEPDIIDFDIAPYEEELKDIARCNTREDRPVDDEKVQEELRDCHRLLTKNRHETFVVKHRIEEARKNFVKDPRMERRVSELRKEKIRLREEEVELREKVNKLQKQLRRNWERNEAPPRAGHHHGTPTTSFNSRREFWDLVPPQFQRCIHALYVVVAPSWQSRGAAVILTAAALRHAKDVGADMAIAEVLCNKLVNLIKPFGFFELRSVPYSNWKDRKGQPLFKIKGSDRSVLAVTFFQKTLIESKL